MINWNKILSHDSLNETWSVESILLPLKKYYESLTYKEPSYRLKSCYILTLDEEFFCGRRERKLGFVTFKLSFFLLSMCCLYHLSEWSGWAVELPSIISALCAKLLKSWKKKYLVWLDPNSLLMFLFQGQCDNPISWTFWKDSAPISSFFIFFYRISRWKWEYGRKITWVIGFVAVWGCVNNNLKKSVSSCL
jgi:hypothetical protein